MSTSIKKRWDSKTVDHIHHIVLNGGGVTPDISPFKPIDGMVDLRGFPFYENLTFKKCELEDVDISGATLRNAWIEKCIFLNVRFDKTNLTGISDHGNSFISCSFFGTSFNGAAIGYKGSIFNNCKFEKSNFSNTSFIRAEMTKCLFSDCKFKSIDFNASSFEECAFSGQLKDVWFRGGFAFESDIKEFGKPKKNLMLNVSFASASLWGVTFSNNCNLSTIDIPKGGNHKIYTNWKNRLDNLKDEINNWPTSEKNEAMIFVQSYLVHANSQDWYVLNIDEIIQEFGKIVGYKIINTLDSYLKLTRFAPNAREMKRGTS